MKFLPNENKNLINLFAEMSANIFSTLNCMKIGKIVSVDKSKQTVDVQIMSKKRVINDTGANELTDYPILTGVPFVVLRGGKSFISLPIDAGDECVLLFNDNELDGWYVSGQSVPDDYDRKHDLSDAVAIVGVGSLVNLIKSYTDFVELHYSDTSKITIGETITVDNPMTTFTGNVNVAQSITAGTSVTAPTLSATTAYTGVFVAAPGATLTISNGIVIAAS